jgi:hypothetical protein
VLEGMFAVMNTGFVRSLRTPLPMGSATSRAAWRFLKEIASGISEARLVSSLSVPEHCAGDAHDAPADLSLCRLREDVPCHQHETRLAGHHPTWTAEAAAAVGATG